MGRLPSSGIVMTVREKLCEQIGESENSERATDARGELGLKTDIRDILLIYDFMLPNAILK